MMSSCNCDDGDECTRPRWRCDSCDEDGCDARRPLQCQACRRPQRLCLHCVDEQFDGGSLAEFLSAEMRTDGVQFCLDCAITIKVNYFKKARAFLRRRGYEVEPLGTLRFRTRRESSFYFGEQIVSMFADDDVGRILVRFFRRFVLCVLRRGALVALRSRLTNAAGAA